MTRVTVDHAIKGLTINPHNLSCARLVAAYRVQHTEQICRFDLFKCGQLALFYLFGEQVGFWCRDDLSRQVFSSGVYAQKGPQDMPNENDGIYNQSGGATLLSVTQDGDGFRATFPMAVQLT